MMPVRKGKLGMAMDARNKGDERPENVRLSDDGRGVTIIDQTKLPNEKAFLTLRSAEEMHDAIARLCVRGAPAIGIFAGYALYCLARQIEPCETDAWLAALRERAAYLDSARPTAVNLSWATARMVRVAEREVLKGASVDEVLASLERESHAIQDEDVRMCAAIAAHGLALLDELGLRGREGAAEADGSTAPFGILTHCNAGPLATSRYGTALGPILLGHERGRVLRVFADETRPLLQGARLTAYELQEAGVNVTLICDNMASMVMKSGWVQACLVGCDRVAANGDVANKIGTSGVAVLAKHYGVPFYVLGPTSTVDMACATGADIRIEERDPDEIRTMFYREPMAPEGVRCFNPAFDVTDHELITAIVTEKGICYPPYTESLAALFE